MDKERWREIPCFDDYFVSSWGRIRSFKEKGNGKLLSQAIRKSEQGKPMYYFVHLLGNNGKYSIKLVHGLVCLAFIGPCPQGKQVCHWDGDGFNNHLLNLRYDTPKGNGKDVLHYRYSKWRESLINSKQCLLIKKAIAKKISELYQSKIMNMPELAKKTGLSVSTVYRYIVGEIKWDGRWQSLRK